MGNRNDRTVATIADTTKIVDQLIKKNASNEKFKIVLNSAGDGFYYIEHNGRYPYIMEKSP